MLSVVFRGSVAALYVCTAFAQLRPGDDPGDFIRQGQELVRQGKEAEALKLYRQSLSFNPDSYPANSAAGTAADLGGDYAAAHAFFAKAIQVSSGVQKIRALRDMAISFGFAGNCKDGVKYDEQAYRMELDLKDFYNAGEVADELARLCIDNGDLDSAQQWYKTGHDAGLQEPGIKPDRVHLWEFRWEHAQARLAARRADAAAAQEHVEAAKAVLSKGDNPQQEQFLPYLLGYVAFYGGDYKTALNQFLQAAQSDAFILTMIGETLEKLGRNSQALDYYRRALTVSAHNPPVAYARPFAKTKIH